MTNRRGETAGGPAGWTTTVVVFLKPVVCIISCVCDVNMASLCIISSHIHATHRNPRHDVDPPESPQHQEPANVCHGQYACTSCRFCPCVPSPGDLAAAFPNMAVVCFFSLGFYVYLEKVFFRTPNVSQPPGLPFRAPAPARGELRKKK